MEVTRFGCLRFRVERKTVSICISIFEKKLGCPIDFQIFKYPKRIVNSYYVRE